MTIVGHFGAEGQDIQRPFDVAVVIPTLLRPTLTRAVRSVFAQSFPGRIQVVIGIDKALGDRAVLDEVAALRRPGSIVTLVDPGYSTSRRHGGVHVARDGGAIRTIMSLIANSRYVAYLDDDNWLHRDHLGDMLNAIRGFDWAFAYRWFVDPDTQEPLCVDVWESVGPGRGTFKPKFNGWVDPNCLMVDKLACALVLPWWTIPLPRDPTDLTSDRNVFHMLMTGHSVAWTRRPTVYYVLNAKDPLHPHRMKVIRRKLGLPEPEDPRPGRGEGGRAAAG